MSAIQPDLSNKHRCASVHWALPVQCELPPTHRENWHETRHPQSGRLLRYNYPSARTEEMLEDGTWSAIDIPKPIPASEQRIRHVIADAIRDLKRDYPDNIKAWVALGHAEAVARGRQFSLGVSDLKSAPPVVHAMYGGTMEIVDGHERPVTPCGFREPQRATGVRSEITCGMCLDVLSRAEAVSHA
jgi:hypothetical protein